MTESNDSRAKHREHIQQRTESVRGKRGPVSFVWGNHVAKPGQRVPGAPGLWSPLPEGEAGLLVEASARDGIVIDGRTVDGSAKLVFGPDHPDSVAYFPNGAEGIVFSYDKKRFALQVWNPESVWAQQFSHIQAYDWSTEWIVEARVEKVTDGRTIAISHHRNPIPVERPVAAKVTFAIDGAEQTLYGTRYGDTYMFHFTDATSGHASYGSGRAVHTPMDRSGAVSIDFNYARLLPCSFSRAWNCPIPSLENRLRVPIEAGERFAVDHDGVPML
ncbi:MAG: DUF1684 domain-containing protein [Betaproteobacteria bacterium]|nr:DUF1684 domain-containing protein [Betaproteobacteria bacterium]